MRGQKVRQLFLERCCVQIESLTFSWMTYDQAETIVRRVLAGEFDHATYGTVAGNRLQTPDQHGRCHLCA